MPTYSNNLEQLINQTGEVISVEELKNAMVRKDEINEEMYQIVKDYLAN